MRSLLSLFYFCVAGLALSVVFGLAFGIYQSEVHKDALAAQGVVIAQLPLDELLLGWFKLDSTPCSVLCSAWRSVCSGSAVADFGARCGDWGGRCSAVARAPISIAIRPMKSCKPIESHAPTLTLDAGPRRNGKRALELTTQAF